MNVNDLWVDSAEAQRDYLLALIATPDTEACGSVDFAL